LVVLTPALLALLLLVIAAGRISSAKGQVEEAARDGARAASLARSSDQATNAARRAALANLETGQLCISPSISVTGDFAKPAGTPRSVRVSVTCTARLSDIALPGLPGAKSLSASYVVPIDTFRGAP
jgi:Flp pilus assembly protein TadG